MRTEMLNIPEMSDLGGEFLEQSLNFNTGDYSQLETTEEPGRNRSNQEILLPDWLITSHVI